MKEGDFDLKKLLHEEAKVLLVDATVDEIRNFSDIDDDTLETAFDEAQGEVFSDKATEAFVVIRISK